MANVILVNKQGERIGIADVLDAHTGEGKLHKAFSVYIFRKGGKEILIQRRSAKKMLWPLVWANTWCSHPREEESPIEAGERRGPEEMGFTCKLTEGPAFVYHAIDPHKKGVEHEHVTILIGEIENDVKIEPDPAEVAEYKWMDVDTLMTDMKAKPDDYAPWFHIGLQKILGNR